MNIKNLFEKAENGTLTYDQFITLAQENKAKFIDLSEGGYVDKQKYTDDISVRDTRIGELTTNLSDRQTDLANLQQQLKDAGADNEQLSKITADFSALQTKYNDDTAAYQKKLEEQAYKFAVNNFANSQKFTSQAAKRDFINTMIAKHLQMEDDQIIGANDFVSNYAKDNEDAFVQNNSTDSQAADKPHFVDSTNNNSDSSSTNNPFKFNFTGVRSHNTK